MPISKLPIHGGAYRNADDVTLNDRSALLLDGFVDELGATNKRPGLLEKVDLGTGRPVDGLFWWDKGGVVIATSDGKVFKIDSSFTVTNITGDPLLDFFSAGIGARTYFVSFSQGGEDYVMMCNGGEILRYGGAVTTTQKMSSVDANAPTQARSIAFLDGYVLVSLVNSTKIRFSQELDAFTWPLLNFFTAESDADLASGIRVSWREVMVLGTKTVETWWNDGVTPFARLEGAFIQTGVISPNSFVDVGGQWTWFNNDRKLIVLSGRQPSVQSTPFDRELAKLTKPEQGIADVVQIAGRVFYILTFPSDDRTYVFDFTRGGEGWAEWGYWNPVTSLHERWKGNSYCYAVGFGKHLVGDRTSGKVYELSLDNLDDNGEAIRTLRRTGHISHGVNTRKRSNILRVRMKRGLGNANVTEPMLMVRYRDSNGPWQPERPMSLGKIGEDGFIGTLFKNGVYITRQWEFSHADRSGLILVEAEEDYEVLTR